MTIHRDKKNNPNPSFFEKMTTFAVLKKGKVNNIIQATDEKDISAVKKEEEQYSRIQGENVNTQRQACSCCPQSQGKEKAYRLR
jgi:hypothetical protein